MHYPWSLLLVLLVLFVIVLLVVLGRIHFGVG